MVNDHVVSISCQMAGRIGLEEAVLHQLLSSLDALTASPDHTTTVNCQKLLQLTPFWGVPDVRRLLERLRSEGLIEFAPPLFGSASVFAFTLRRQPPSTQREPPPPSRTRSIHHGWRPSPDTVAQLLQLGIPESFVDAQIAEFVIYWSERGDPLHSWNAKFLKRVVHSWREEEAENSRRSRETQMTPRWRPSDDAIQLLVQHRGVDREFVECAIPDFVLYWTSRGEKKVTWETDFVRYCLARWKRHSAEGVHGMVAQNTRERSLVEDLTDRSWAG